MAELSEDCCLAISRTSLEPVIGHLRQSVHAAIEKENTDPQRTEAISDGERESDSTEPDNDPGSFERPYRYFYFSTDVFRYERYDLSLLSPSLDTEWQGGSTIENQDALIDE